MSLRLVFLVCIGTVIKFSDCQCTWPSDFQNSTWIDSDKGNIVFDTSTMTGWAFDVQVQAGASVQTLNSWECVTYNDTYLVMKTTGTFVQFVVNIYTGYRCLRLIKLTDNSYRYYETTPVLPNLGGIRLHINENPGITSISEVCLVQYQASGSEFKVMIKSGSEAAAKIYCPYNFLANHTFAYSTSSTGNACDPVTDTGTIDLCSNVTELAFISPSCVTTSFYSDANAVWCVDVVPVGTETFVSLYNGEQAGNTVDGTTYTSFACIGVNGDYTQMSVTPNSCKSNQSSTSLPVDNLGNTDGAVLTITNTGTACPPCPVLPNPFRGNVTIATSGAVTTATYTCGSTYTLSGDGTRVCQSDGTWSGSTPSCACPVLYDPTNGAAVTSTDALTVTFTCNVGTVLVGSVTLTCDTISNTWSDSSPTCNDCQTLISPVNGSFVLSSNGLTSSVTYSCDVGTTLNGVQSRTCQTDTTWNNAIPTCTFCAVLPNPDSGNVTITSNGLVSTATYLCADGYSLQGSNMASCGTTGTWDATAPICLCNSPPTPMNGSVTISSDSITATYTCDTGTTLNGSSTRTCQNDGSGWSSTDPICVTCLPVIVMDNGTYSLSSNGTVTMVTYSCDVGTSLIGDSTSVCLSDGTWSSSSPNCTKCNSFSQPSSGSYALSTNGVTTTATFSCDVGTTISGDVIISCLENGTWTTTNSSVSCVSCPDLGTLSAGLSTLSSNGTTTTARFDCAQGYGLVGTSTSTCQSDGTWSASTPTCVSTPSSTSESETGSLLPAVIVLAVLTTAFAVAFGILLYLYFKARRENSMAYGQQYDTIEDDVSIFKTTKKIPSAHAPVDHQRHVMSPDKLTASRAPTGFSFKDSFGISESVTPRSLASSVTLPLHLVREATTSSIHEQPPAPWASTTPRTSPESVSNPRTPRKGKKSPRKSAENGVKNPMVLSLDSLDNKEDTTAAPDGNYDVIKRKKKKKSVLIKANSMRGNAHRADKTLDNEDDTDVPSVDINEELNSSRQLYSSMYALLEKQENTLNSVLGKGSSVRENGKRTTDRRGLNRAHSTSPIVRANTPVKHSMQINDPQSCITPRSNIISTVE